MKKFSILFCILLYLQLPVQLAFAEENLQDLFISVGDAMMKTKADDWEAVETHISQLNDYWEHVQNANSVEGKNVEQAIKELNLTIEKHNKEEMLAALSEVSHALVAFEKEQNPVNEQEQREEVKVALTPILINLKTAIENENAEEVQLQYKKFLSMWNRKESIVREQSIPYYGKIETQTGFLRMALTKDEKDFQQMQTIYQALERAVNEFTAGEELQVENTHYSLQTLIDVLENANQSIEDGKLGDAVSSLQEFLTIWPTVEGDVRTKNGSLYTKLESEIPIIAGKLSSKSPNIEEQQKKLKEYKQAIELLQSKTSYTIWDAALIMLREGLEALLIVAALIAFLQKANAREQQKWIWFGALAGIIMSIVAAILLNILFSTATQGANREFIEGVTGLVAVVMMLGVGMWLHQKSNMKAWNNYINKQMGHAVSTGSIVSMAFISFLSIFREGAETIIFYMGMAPSISNEKLITGISIAVVILIIFAFIIIRFSTRMAIGPFFKLATVLIYIIAFKILGVSLHALQITNHISTTQIQELPIISFIGFYPTWETIIPQLLLLAIILISTIRARK